jgi:polyphenol oxidase
MKDFSATDLISALKQVRWSTTSSTSSLLTELRIQHGFIGTLPAEVTQANPPHHCRQVHGTEIISASALTLPSIENATRTAADGLYSLDGQCIAIKTADCLPVLVAATHSPFTQAVHAGWRGLTSGILFNAVKIAGHYQPVKQCRFVIGPAISREAFEVGPEIVDALKSEACGLLRDSWQLPLSKGKADRWHVDLSLAAVLQLLRSGVEPEHIEVLRACTVLDTKDEKFLWNSFRRQGKGCDSNWSWIQNGSTVKNI